MSEQITVLAIDPGRTTGFCYATIEGGEAILLPWQERTEVHTLWEVLEARAAKIIVIEKFEFRKNSREGLDMHPRELIGIARLHSVTHHSEWYEQAASQGMGYYTDAELKRGGIYLDKLPHARDATRHLLHWFTYGAGYKYNTTGKQYPFRLVTQK